MEPTDKPSVENDPDRESDRTKRYCVNCAKELIPTSARYCPYCGAAQDQAPAEPERAGAPAVVSLAQRTATLNRAIAHFTAQGFRIVSKSETSAQLMRPKQFSWLAAILSFLLLGIGFLIYLAYYLGKKDESIFLEVAPDGTILKDGHAFSIVAQASPVKPPAKGPSIEGQPEKRTERIPARRRFPLLVRALAGIAAVAVAVYVTIVFFVELSRVLSGYASPPPSLTLYPTVTPYPTSTPYPTNTAPPAVLVTPSPTSSPMSPTPMVHVVQPGDTLSGIASLYGTTAEAICALNQLADCRLITPGQQLMIPGEGVILPSPTKPAPTPSPTPQPSPTATPLVTPTPPRVEGIMQVTSHGTTWDVKVKSVEKETMLKSTYSGDVTYAAGEYWILTLEVINRGRRTDSFIVVDLALQLPGGGAVYEDDWRATGYVEAARDMALAAWKIDPGQAGYTVEVFDVPVGTTELMLISQGIVSRSEGTIVVRP